MDKRTKELNRQNNELDKKIDSQNNAVYTDMICYLRGANISEYNQERVRQDLIEMILSAQSRGESIRDILGENDSQSFCDAIIENLPGRTIKERIVDGFDIAFIILSIMGMFFIVEGMVELLIDHRWNQILEYRKPVSIGEAVIFVGTPILVCTIFELITKNAFKTDLFREKCGIKSFLFAVAMIICFSIILVLGKKVIFTVNLLLACIIVIGLYLGHRVMKGLQK